MDLWRLSVCHECLTVLRRPIRVPGSRIGLALPYAQTAKGFVTTTSPSTTYRTRRSLKVQVARIQHNRCAVTESLSRGSPATSQAPDLNAIHTRVQELSSSVLRHEAGQLPSEQRILYVLEQLQSLAKLVLDEKGPEGILKPNTNANGRSETATSALLGSVNARSYPAFISKASILDNISQKSEEIVRHRNVFITPAILKAYVEVQSFLQQPSSFPDVFRLYAEKPVPRVQGSSEIAYSPASPDKINAAIDSTTAIVALTSAIQSHNLPLAIDVITTSFSTPAFKKSKIIRQAAIPIAGLAVAPLAAYALSTSFSSMQQTMDPSTASGVAFAGIMTYIGAVSMVGYVAVTTANDQMDRVTWASGVPLWERWIREEERAAIDRVASAWGFKDPEKRGEEEGEEWESLREWVGVRGMVLDRVSLMEGME